MQATESPFRRYTFNVFGYKPGNSPFQVTIRSALGVDDARKIAKAVCAREYEKRFRGTSLGYFGDRKTTTLVRVAYDDDTPVAPQAW